MSAIAGTLFGGSHLFLAAGAVSHAAVVAHARLRSRCRRPRPCHLVGLLDDAAAASSPDKPTVAAPYATSRRIQATALRHPRILSEPATTGI